MKASILKRLEDIELRAKKLSSDVPDLIMIFYRRDLKKWIVQQSFIPASGDGYRTIADEFETLEGYELLKGFQGTCLIDDIDMPDDQESPVTLISKRNEPEEYDLVYRDYGET